MSEIKEKLQQELRLWFCAAMIIVMFLPWVKVKCTIESEFVDSLSESASFSGLQMAFGTYLGAIVYLIAIGLIAMEFLPIFPGEHKKYYLFGSLGGTATAIISMILSKGLYDFSASSDGASAKVRLSPQLGFWLTIALYLIILIYTLRKDYNFGGGSSVGDLAKNVTSGISGQASKIRNHQSANQTQAHQASDAQTQAILQSAALSLDPQQPAPQVICLQQPASGPLLIYVQPAQAVQAVQEAAQPASQVQVVQQVQAAPQPTPQVQVVQQPQPVSQTVQVTPQPAPQVQVVQQPQPVSQTVQVTPQPAPQVQVVQQPQPVVQQVQAVPQPAPQVQVIQQPQPVVQQVQEIPQPAPQVQVIQQPQPVVQQVQEVPQPAPQVQVIQQPQPVVQQVQEVPQPAPQVQVVQQPQPVVQQVQEIPQPAPQVQIIQQPQPVVQQVQEVPQPAPQVQVVQQPQPIAQPVQVEAAPQPAPQMQPPTDVTEASDTKPCPQCGKPVKATGKFCGKCGYHF